MSQVQQIVKKVKFQKLSNIVGSQILFYCYVNDIWLNKSEFDTLVHIAMNGYNKNSTLKEIVDKGIFKSEQCVRNARGKLAKLGLLKELPKKNFEINPELSIVNKGRVWFEIKMINVDEA